MGRTLLILLAVLLALSSPVVAAVTVDGPRQSADRAAVTLQDAENATRMLALPENESVRSAYVSPSPSVGTSLDMHRGELERELDAAALERRLDAAESSEAKRNALWQFSYEVEDRIESLRVDDQRAREAFVNGSISADEYARRLALINARAERLHGLNDEMRSFGSDVRGVSFDTRYFSLQFQLAVVTGPVRERIQAATTGEASPTRVHIAATRNGVVLSTIDGGAVVREITRADLYSAGGQAPDQYDGEPRDRIESLYPYASDSDNYNSQRSRKANVGISRFYFENTPTFGEITLYLDDHTGGVFKEIREQRLAFVSTGSSVRTTADGLNVTANATYPGGPLLVNVTDAETGDPVRATVSVDEESLVTTGSDGEAWLVAPHGRFTLSVSGDGATANVTVVPPERLRPGESSAGPATP